MSPLLAPPGSRVTVHVLNLNPQGGTMRARRTCCMGTGSWEQRVSLPEQLELRGVGRGELAEGDSY